MKNIETQDQVVSQQLSHPTEDGAKPAPSLEVGHATHIFRTNPIKDIPATSDAFSNQKEKIVGPHQTVADVIASMIRDPREEGISIGLEGSWGSGKTTVIKLLCEALKDGEKKDDPNICLIQFDAWAHEGDPLRRTFLETLIRRLEKKEWVSTPEWDEELKKLANRKEVTTTKETPTLTGWGKAVGLSLLFVPLGGALFGQFIREPVVFYYTGVIVWRAVVEFLLGLIFSFAPLLILIPKKARKSGVLELILNKGASETRTETDKTPNATSIEFEDYFKRLMSDALREHPERRLILVLDNLDRVDTKDALSIWSTLQTFMQHKRDEDSPWYARLWTIVLYDPKALSMLWKDKETDGTASQTASPGDASAESTAATATTQGQQPDQQGNIESQNQVSQPTTSESSGAMGEIATSFIDKSFQIRFEVSPPIPSNWYKFLIDQVKYAFPDHFKEKDDKEKDNGIAQLHTVYRVLSIDRTLSKQPTPTIRELKLYVNQIGALHRQLALRGKCKGEDSFPLSLMAYYVLLRRRRPNADIAEGVLTKNLPEKDFRGLLGEREEDKLAALHYNVDVKRARQVIIGPVIKKALQEGNKDELINCSDPADAFWVVLSDIIYKEWNPKGVATVFDSTGFSKAARTLDEAQLLEGSVTLTSAQTVIENLREVALKIASWLPLDEVRKNGIVSLFNLIRDKDFAGTILERMTMELVTPLNNPPSLDIRDLVESGLRPILHKVGEIGWPELYKENVIEPLSKKLRDEEKSLGGSFTKVLEIFCELRRTDFDPSDTVSIPGTAREALSKLVSEGHVSRHLTTEKDSSGKLVTLGELSQFLPNDSALGLLVIIREDPKTALQLIFKKSETDEDYHQRAIEAFKNLSDEFPGVFLNQIARYDEWRLLFQMLEADSAYQPLVIKTLALAADRPNENFTIEPADFLKHWSLLEQELYPGSQPNAFDKLLTLLVERSSLAQATIEQGFQIERAKLYGKIYEAAQGDTKFREWLREGLEAISSEEWESQFLNEGELLKLVNLLANNGDKFRDDSRYRTALNNYADAILNERITPKHRLSTLADILSKDRGRLEFQETLDKAFAARVRESEGNVPPVFFGIFGWELARFEHPYNTINALPQLFSALLKKRDASGIEWAASMVEAHSSTFDDPSWAPLAASFREQVRQAVIEETDETFIPILMKIADALNVPITGYIGEAYDKAIKNMVDLWHEKSFSALNLLRAMREEKILFSISDIGSDKDAGSGDLSGGEWKIAASEDFRPVKDALRKVGLLVNASSDRDAIERPLMAILDDYYKKETEKSNSEGKGTHPESTGPTDLLS